MNKETMATDWDSRAQEDWMKAVFGKPAEMDTFWTTGEQLCEEWIEPHAKELIGDISQKTALEIGCGPGRILKPLSKRFKQVIGVDISAEMLDLCRQNMGDDPGVTLVKSEGASFRQVADESVDLAVSFEVFQHMPDVEIIRQTLDEACRVLKPGAAFVFQMKTATGWVRRYGVPVFPYRLIPYIPESLMQTYLKLKGVRPERRKRTWRGPLIPLSKLGEIFADANLTVLHMFPYDKTTKRVVVGLKKR